MLLETLPHHGHDYFLNVPQIERVRPPQNHCTKCADNMLMGLSGMKVKAGIAWHGACTDLIRMQHSTFLFAAV